MQDNNPFSDALDEILTEKNNNEANQFIISEQSKSNLNNAKNENKINLIEDNNLQINNEIELNEDEEIKSINKTDKNSFKNSEKLELNSNSLLGKKTKPDNDLESIQTSSVNKNVKNTNMNSINNKNDFTKEFTTKSDIKNENKIKEGYDYGYSIYL